MTTPPPEPKPLLPTNRDPAAVAAREGAMTTAAPPTPKPHEDRDPAAGAARASEEGR